MQVRTYFEVYNHTKYTLTQRVYIDMYVTYTHHHITAWRSLQSVLDVVAVYLPLHTADIRYHGEN
jgi:hypothetical protein